MPLPGDIAEWNSLATRARSHAERFSLPLRERNWRGGPGDYAGAGIGSSLDFQDHRSYLPGDDPRHINWQAYARTGHYSLKLYREEVRPVVEILLDVSESMFADPAKATRTLELLYFSLASAEKAGATVSLVLLKGPGRRAVEMDAIHSHRWRDLAAELPPTVSAAPPDLGSVPLRARSLRVLLSDLLFSASPEPILRSLLRSNGRAIVLAPFAPDEASPEWEGNCEFIDTESGERRQRRVDESLKRRYQTAYRDHFGRWKAASLRTRTPLARIASGTAFESALQIEAIPVGALILT